jgi:hypothetical protein
MKNPEKIDGYRCQKQMLKLIEGNPGVIKPLHIALYFWIEAKCNKLRWIEVFDLPTKEAMFYTGIKYRETIIKILSELEKFGLISIISKSRNQSVPYKIKLIFEAEKHTLACGSKPQAELKEDISLAVQNRRQNRSKPQAKLIKTASDPHESPINKGVDTPLNLLKPFKTIRMSASFGTDYKPSNIFETLAYKLWSQCLDILNSEKINPVILKRANPKVWANDIRLLIEIDKRTEAEIFGILNFLKADSFWNTKIQSPEKLRKQFEKLQLAMKTKKDKVAPNPYELSPGQYDVTKMEKERSLNR